MPQDTDQLINPLAMPLFLDRAETVLVEHVKEHADAIKGAETIRAHARNTLEHVFEPSSSKSAIQSLHVRARSREGYRNGGQPIGCLYIGSVRFDGVDDATVW